MKYETIDIVFLKKLPTELLRKLKIEIDDILKGRSFLTKISSDNSSPNYLFYDEYNESHKNIFEKQKHKLVDDCGLFFDMMSESWEIKKKNPDTKQKYYVYIHCEYTSSPLLYRSKDGKNKILFNKVPFYIGKGCGGRLESKNRTNLHRAKMESNNLIAPQNKWTYIFRDKLNEVQALELEAKLILFFGCNGQTKGNPYLSGLKTGVLVNNQYPFVPEKYKTFIFGGK